MCPRRSIPAPPPTAPEDAGRARFHAWVVAHHAEVYRCAWRITRHAADALDVTQQVFLQVLRAPERLAEHESPSRALRWLAIRTALTLRRGDANRRRREEDHAMQHDERVGDAAEDPARRELLRSLRQKIAELPEELRVATVLRFQEGLTFAAMADLVGTSEPTMFDRVNRALEKLRIALTQAGHGGALVELESLLAIEESVAVPAKLCGSLLGLSVATTSVTAWVAAAVVAVAIAGGGAIAVQTDRTRAREESAAAARATPEARTPTAPSAAAALAPHREEVHRTTSEALVDTNGASASDFLTSGMQLPIDDEWRNRKVGTTHIRGRVVDEDGVSLAMADVSASSSDGAPKAYEWRSKATSGSDGSFDLLVAVVLESARQTYQIAFAHPDVVGTGVDRIVALGETIDLGEVTLHRNVAERAGAYELTIRVVGPNGEPVAGAGVRLLRKVVTQAVPATGYAGQAYAVDEAWGQTDADGTLRLKGDRIGAKAVEANAVSAGYRLADFDFTIDAPGVHEQRVALESGLTLSGRLVVPDGMDVKKTMLGELVPIKEVDGSDLVAGNDWPSSGGFVRYSGARLVAKPVSGDREFEAKLEADGRFSVRGLDPGHYRLTVWGEFSTVRLDDIEAGREDIEIPLKRQDDPRDIGPHLAEIHGRIVDADGKPVAVDPDNIRTIPLPDDWKPDDPRVSTELVPSALAPQIAQTFFDSQRRKPLPSSSFHVTSLEVEGAAKSFVVLVTLEGYDPGVSNVVTLKPREITTDVIVSLKREK